MWTGSDKFTSECHSSIPPKLELTIPHVVNSPFRVLFKHSAVFGIGQVLRRLSSFLLLPVYTNYLRPADYGIIAILDFVTTIFAIMIGAGMVNAVTRYSFEAEDEAGRNRVWWTGLTFIAGASTVILVPALIFRESLAGVALGKSVTEGALYLAIALPTMWLNIVQAIPDAYLRVRKWSSLSVAVNLFRLILNISLNVAFLVVWEMGVIGILVGNLIAVAFTACVQFFIFTRHVQSYQFDSPLLRMLLQFGMPLIVTTLLSLLMHQADRYILRLFVGMEQVGIYSLAYTIGQGVFQLCLMPFAMIWGVVIYEIAKRPDAKQIYVQVFEYFIYGLGLIMLGVSLFSKSILTLMVDPAYLPAASIIPVICLAYIFFSLHDHFRVPVMLEKRTVQLVPVYIAGALINIGGNFLLIPVLGTSGAAWVSVLTFAGFSFLGLWRYRKVDCFDYPFVKCGTVLCGMVGSYLAFQWLVHGSENVTGSIGLAAGIWFVWLFILFGTKIRQVMTSMSMMDIKSAMLSLGSHANRSS